MQRMPRFVAQNFFFIDILPARITRAELSHDNRRAADFHRALTPEDYIQQRVDDQIAWHSKKSGTNRKIYQTLTFIAIIAAACIPLLSAIAVLSENAGTMTPLVAGSLGVLITILSGANSLFRFHENWVEYRLIVEALKRERYLFLAGVEPYKATEAFPEFVERVEALIAKTVVNWGQNARRRVISRDPKQPTDVAVGTDEETPAA